MPALSAAQRTNFSDVECDPVFYASLPLRQPPVAESHAQTEKISLRNMRIQASDVASVETQTDECPKCDLEKDAKSGWLRNPQADETKLALFLKNVHKDMLTELSDNIDTHSIFSCYEPHWESDRDEGVRLVHSFQCPQDSVPPALDQKNAVLDCAWNCTGNVIAVSYGKLNTLGWCEYSSLVAVWNIFQRCIVHSP